MEEPTAYRRGNTEVPSRRTIIALAKEKSIKSGVDADHTKRVPDRKVGGGKAGGQTESGVSVKKKKEET